MDKKDKLINVKFGKLLCVENLGRKGHNYLLKCKCECGNFSNVLDSNLKAGRTISCGCLGQGKSNQNINWKGCGEISYSYFSNIKREAIKRKLNFDITIGCMWHLFLIQEGKCALSGIPLKFRTNWKERNAQTASLDRIDSKKGYIKDNIQWIHKNINFMKGDLEEDFFIKMCEKISFFKKNSKNDVKQNVLDNEFLIINNINKGSD